MLVVYLVQGREIKLMAIGIKLETGNSEVLQRILNRWPFYFFPIKASLEILTLITGNNYL